MGKALIGHTPPFKQLIVGWMRRGQPDLELVGDGGETRVRVVDDEAPDLDLRAATPDTEHRSTIDQLPDVDDENCVAGEEGCVMLSSVTVIPKDLASATT